MARAKHALRLVMEFKTKTLRGYCECKDWEITAEGPSSFKMHERVINQKYEEHLHE